MVIGVVMRCIYSNGVTCFAGVPNFRTEYKPTEEELKELCNSNNFSECPRYKAVLDILKSRRPER